MITLAQRIEALRTERGLSRPALSQALGFPKNAAEKFETGRQTPHPGAAGEDGRLFSGSPSSISGGRATTAPVRRPGWTAASRMRRSLPPPPRRAARPVPQSGPCRPGPGHGV